MARTTATLFAIVCALILANAWILTGADAAATSAPSDWPHWRGPTGNGTSLDADPPTTWNDAKNVHWKVKIPGRGSASPVVWRDRVYVASAIALGEAKSKDEQAPQRFVLIAIDRASGKIVWEKTAVEATPHEGHHDDHGFASASPCTDGERVYAHFGSRGVFCFDLAGELKWKKTDFGKMETRLGFGEGSSPAIHGDIILVPWDHQGPSALYALDKRTGDLRWRAERDEPSCWATPLVVAHGDKKIVVVSGERFARGYDFATGDEIWRVSGQTGRPIASPVAGHGLAFIGSGFRGSFLGAFRLDGKGDLRETEGVAWSLDRHTPDVPSPLLSGDRLYFFAGRNGILSCHEALTGKPHFSATRVPGLTNVYACPVGAAGRIYLTARDGTTVVIKDATALEVLSTNALGEPVDATPALAGTEIYIRGQEHLFAIAE